MEWPTMLFPLNLIKRTVVLSLFFAICYSPTLFADHLMITRYFSGAWAQPDHESQGLVLHIAEQAEDAKVGVAHWFTFAEDLESAWYVALGPVDGHTINMTLFAASGIGFLEPDAEGDAHVEEVGTLTLSFHNCNKGIATFDTPEEVLGSGEFRIQRLTSLFHSRCSGGISDDTPSDKRPEKLSVRLAPARDDISGDGKAMFWQRSDRSDFKVEVEGMPDGVYDLLVCETDVGDIEVAEGEGEVEYRSPAIDSKLLLDFDPRDCRIDVSDDLGVALTSGDAVLAAHEPGPKEKEHEGLKIEVDLTNTGVLPDAEGEAEFEMDGDETEFEVEVENVPAGFYPLLVGGEEKGQIEVVENDGKLKGKLKFKNPQTAETELLDFDPLILESLFPNE
jgi:hypothetical protein